MKHHLISILLLAAAPMAQALTIEFDYSSDVDGFFSGANLARRDYLTTAANAWLGQINQSFSAITPGGGNSWTPNYFDPSTGSITTASNLSIAANTIKIYAGGRSTGWSSAFTLAEAAPGGYSSASGSLSWFDTLDGRGLVGGGTTVYSLWGGSIAFNTTQTWHFDSDPTTVESGALSGKNDFYSVAVHELGHIFGYTNDTVTNSFIDGSRNWTGALAIAANGGTAPKFESGSKHWLEGTTSTTVIGGANQEVVMEPSIITGTRKYLTDLDVAAMHDIGWTSPIPEPSEYGLMSAGALGLLAAIRRRRKQAA